MTSCLSVLLICQDWMGDVLTNDIADFDGIQMKLRGDGRTYAFNVQTQSIREDDVHQTFIHTRGGPLWEIVRVNHNQLLHRTLAKGNFHHAPEFFVYIPFTLYYIFTQVISFVSGLYIEIIMLSFYLLTS